MSRQGGDRDLLAWFTLLGRLRREQPALQRGAIHYLYTSGPLLAFAREAEGKTLTTVVNAGDSATQLTLAWKGTSARDLLSGQVFSAQDGSLVLPLPSRSGLLLV